MVRHMTNRDSMMGEWFLDGMRLVVVHGHLTGRLWRDFSVDLLFLLMLVLVMVFLHCFDYLLGFLRVVCGASVVPETLFRLEVVVTLGAHKGKLGMRETDVAFKMGLLVKAGLAKLALVALLIGQIPQLCPRGEWWH